MKIFIPKEDSNELRTAISPEIVKKLSGSRHEIFIETIKLKNGYVNVSDQPGLGVRINEEKLEEYKLIKNQ